VYFYNSTGWNRIRWKVGNPVALMKPAMQPCARTNGNFIWQFAEPVPSLSPHFPYPMFPFSYFLALSP